MYKKNTLGLTMFLGNTPQSDFSLSPTALTPIQLAESGELLLTCEHRAVIKRTHLNGSLVQSLYLRVG